MARLAALILLTVNPLAVLGNYFVQFTFKAKDKDKFLDAFASEDGANITRHAQGLVSMDVLTSADDSSTVMIYEKWVTKADQQAYMKMRNLTGYLDKLDKLVNSVESKGFTLASRPGLGNDVDRAGPRGRQVSDYAVVFTFKTKDKDQFLDFFAKEDGAKITRSQNGLISMDVLLCENEDSEVILIEYWKSKAHQQAYINMRNVTHYLDKINALATSVASQDFTLATQAGLGNKIRLFVVLTYTTKDKDKFLCTYAKEDGAMITRRQEGFVGMNVLPSVGDSKTVMLYEMWDSKGAQQAYMRMRNITGYLDKLGKLFDNVKSQEFYLAPEDGLSNVFENSGPRGGLSDDYFIVFNFTTTNKHTFLDMFAMKDGAKITREQKGFKNMDVLTSVSDSKTVVLVEQWDTMADQLAYMKMRNVTHYLDKLGKFIESDWSEGFTLAKWPDLGNNITDAEDRRLYEQGWTISSTLGMPAWMVAASMLAMFASAVAGVATFQRLRRNTPLPPDARDLL